MHRTPHPSTLSPRARTLLLFFCTLCAHCLSSLALAKEDRPPASPAAEDLKDAWVAVGYGGRRMISTDGITWEITAEWAQPGKDDSNNLMSLVFAQNKFVAVGGGANRESGPGGHILVSENGRDWREVLSPSNRVNPVVYGNNRFVAGGPKRTLLWSDNAEDWHDGAVIDDKIATHFRHGAFGNGVFLLIGNHGGSGGAYWCVTTKDGTSIDSFLSDLPPIRALTFANDRFVAAGPEGTRASSADGVHWEHHPTGNTAESLTFVLWTGTEFLCGGGKTVYASSDGREWKPTGRSFKARPLWTDGHRFIATAWPGSMSYSDDGGKTWTSSPPLTANGINKVVASPTSPLKL